MAQVGDVQHANKKTDKERKYFVQFIGDNTHQNLPQSKLAAFIDNYDKYSETKKKVSLDYSMKHIEILMHLKIKKRGRAEVNKMNIGSFRLN